MELTPKVFRDVQFREKLRGGYHPEDVDEFLEQAAVAAESVLEQLRQANERAQRAEQAATDASGTDETLKRMLLMAQRTADQAVKEAKEEAERTLADARAQAQKLVADAEVRARASYDAAVNERRSTMEQADAALSQAQQEVEALRGWVDLHRSHLLSIMRDAEALIENAGLVSEPPAATPLPPIWSSGHAEAAPAPVAAPAGDREASAAREPDTGEWDPRYLEDISENTPTSAGPTTATETGWGAPQGAVPGPGGAGPNGPGLPNPGAQQPAAQQPAGAAQAGAPGQPGPQPGGAPPGFAYSPWRPADGAGNGGAAGDPTLAEGPAHRLPGAASTADDGPTGEHRVVNVNPSTDSTLAFDERALDSFFSEQDMGDSRGLGRFRRRQ